MPRKEKAKTNAKNIEKLGKYTIAIRDNSQQLANETDEKFSRVSKDLAPFHAIQNQIIETQNEKWQKIEKQFRVLRDNIHDMRNCDQLLYTRQQVNFNFDTISSLLSPIYSNVKAHRAPLFAFQMNVMNAIPSLLSKYVPMSLLPKGTLEQILKVVDDSQEKSDNRLTVAIPKQELLAYYESCLLLDVLVVDDGLLMTMATPFASRQTAFTVYKAIVLPLPQMDEDMAIKWDVEAEYLAVSENLMETSLVTRDQLDKCIGSSRYRICHETLATENKDSSCLATLYFEKSIDALKVCDTVPVPQPLKVKATNLGYGIWLITSAQANFELKENYMDSTTLAGSKTVKGCRICLITLECGKELTGENFRNRSDLSSCAKVPPVKLDVELPKPMANLFSLLPTVDELPYYNTKVEAKMKLLKSVKF